MTFLKKVKIDSFKLYIPRVLVDFTDPTFCTRYQKLYVDSGVIDEHISLDKHVVDETNGVRSRIGLASLQLGSKREEFVLFQINAKQLKERYFEGITKDNIHLCYEHLMDLNKVHVPLEVFLSGMISDVDFAFDFKSTRDELKAAWRQIYQLVKPSRLPLVGKWYERKDNHGYHFNTREKATPSKPFVKIYHKTTELESKSLDFAEAYLKNVNYSDVARLEFTLKNGRAKKHHNLMHIKTLRDVLELTHSNECKFVFDGFHSYLTLSLVPQFRDLDALSPQEKYMSWLIKLLAQRGHGKASFYAGLDIFEDRQQKGRMKKKLDKILQESELIDMEKPDDKIGEILKQLRLFE